MKKKEIIAVKIKQFLDFTEYHNVLFHEELRRIAGEYTIEQIVGFVERFLIPARDCLSEYIDDEIVRCKALYQALGHTNQDYINFKLEPLAKKELLKVIRVIIKVIEM